MSNLKPPPLATIFYGDVTLESGSDTMCYGYGDLWVNRNVTIYGTTESDSTATGSLIVSGGAYIDKSLYVKKNLTVSSNGIAFLHQTRVSTEFGHTSITGQNGFIVNVQNTSGIFVHDNLFLLSSIGTLSLSSGQSNNDAIKINATNISGGITLNAQLGGININSTDGNINLNAKSESAITLTSEASGTSSIFIKSTGGISVQSDTHINIGTNNSGIPINIGTNNSNVTINGNLFVKGNTTTVDKQVVTIDDNIIVVNNAPVEISDGGFAVKRYQKTSDVSEGELINDTPEETGTIGNVNTSTSVTLDMSANIADDYYKDWWIKITSGQGSGQVRKIKSYNGISKVADIYSTLDQTTSGIQPVEGADFVTIPNTTSVYALFPCQYVMNIWDESNNEFAFVCTPTNPTSENQVQIAHYTNARVNDLTSNGLFANFLNDTIADTAIYVTLNDASVSGFIANDHANKQSISAFPEIHGIYLLFVKPKNDNTRAHAIFMIGKIGGGSAPGTVVRLVSVKGVNGEHLDLVWSNIGASKPELYYRPLPTNGNVTVTTEYKIKLVTI